MTQRWTYLLARFAVVLLLVCARPASAQCNTTTADWVFTTVSPSSQAIATPTTVEFNAGASATVSYTVKVYGLTAGTWYLCLTSVSINAGTVSGYTKPISDFEFSVNGTTWTQFSTTARQVRTGTGFATVNVLIRARLAYARDIPLSVTTPGTYGPVSFEFQALY